MAIQKNNITLDGKTYQVGEEDRMAAQLVNENDNTFTGANTLSGAVTVAAGAKGVQGTIVSSETSVPVAVGNTDITVGTLPAGALITDAGFVVTSVLGGGSGGGTVTVSIGTTEGGAELVAGVAVCDSNSSAAAGSSQSVLNAVEADASGAPFGDFKDAATLYSASARAVYVRFAQGTAVAGAIGKVICFVNYTIVS